MSHASNADGSEDVNDFLQRIRELGDKRDKEDEERTRKLEEEILQGRKERQARRAERARSISPTKETSSNAATPTSRPLDLDMASKRTVIEPPIDLHPSLSRESNRAEYLPQTSFCREVSNDSMPSRELPPSPTKSSVPPRSSPSAAMAPSRVGTLSWQQRPTSRGSNGVRSRPTSVIADADPKPSEPTPESPSAPESEPSRSQIAQSLQSKDPSWFRQTADRGLGSAAYKRNAEESASDTASMTGSMRLPGMSRESTAEPEKMSASEVGNERSPSPSRANSVQSSNTWSNRYSSQTSYTTASGLGSPMPLSSAQRFEPRASDTLSANEPTSTERLAMSPSQGRLSPERPASPTKGLGGFVQSAMLKRSDSVNKRWSTQAPVGLSRGNSIASNHSGYGGSMNAPRGSTSPPRDTRPLSMGRESSPLSNSRPGSSHSSATVVANLKENERPGTSGTMSNRADSITGGGFVKPPLPLNLSKANRTLDANSPKSPEKDEKLPVSPSKTMDPKRWSPTKSSWLESAINKPPDSPKPKSQPSQQPSWMTELNKSKQEKGKIEPTKTGSFKEVATGGLLRSPPMGGPTKPLTIGGLPEGFSSGVVKRSDSGSPTRSDTATAPVDSPNNGNVMELTPNKPISREQARNEPQTSPTDLGKLDKPTPKSTPFASVLTPRRDRSSPTPEVKPKPETPPKKNDFRANLKPRQLPKEDSSNQEPEFKNALGKLKRTQTKNYVAPDELKDNILRGKSGLSVTGGPKKTERVDEFKESILKKKEAMKAGGGTLRRQPSGESDGAGMDKTPPSVPEALAKRRNLTRSNSNLSNDGTSKDSSLSKPEILPESTEESTSGSQTQKSESKTPSKPSVAPKFSPKTSTPGPERRPFQAATSLKDIKESPKLPVDNSTSRRFGTGAILQSQSSKIDPVARVEPLKVASKRVETLDLTKKSATTPPANEPGIKGKLAGILSRGPPTGSVESDASEPAALRTMPSSQKSSQADDSGSGANLTHMTKARARGPKRRLPTSQASEAASTAQTTPVAMSQTKSIEPTLTSPAAKTVNRSPPKTFTPRTLPESGRGKDEDQFDLYPPKTTTPRPLPDLKKEEDSQFADLYPPKNPLVKKRSVFDLDKSSGRSSPQPDKSRPAVSTKSPLLQRVVSPPTAVTGSPGHGASGNDLSSQLSKTSSTTSDTSKPVATRNPASKPTIHEESDSDAEDSNPSFTAARGRFWGGSATQDVSKQINTPDPSRMEAGDLKSEKDDTVGLGLRSVSVNSRGKEPQPRNLPTPPTKTPTSPPVPKKSSAISLNSSPEDQRISPPFSGKSGTATTTKITHRIKPSITSPIPRTSDAQRVILDFFDVAPSAKQKIDFDTQAVLSSKRDVLSKIMTLKWSIWEVNGDGKRLDMPTHQEYILFEECMYLIIHNYAMPNGTKANEVILWCGDSVGEAAIEDAQLFCRKVARENSTKLTVTKQGKETSSLIQALGGILITRRRRANSMYMLCCRQHLGQIVFDEVDLSPSTLCSAFPYIISAKFGKLYLWKGKGSAAEELGCARLIGMDLGLTGEFEELSEEEEPLGFFEAFPDNREQSVPKSSQNWAQKPNHGKYACRLFHISHESRQTSSIAASFFSRRGSPPPETSAAITEVDPFCQSDLDPGNIYVLDAFFEIYVIVGKASASKSAEFVTAVLFAQEYGILAASIQDRPFIPASSVVMGGLPKDATAAFRKWKDDRKREPLIVVELNAAVEALMNA